MFLDSTHVRAPCSWVLTRARVVDLEAIACDEDISIVFTGLRAGEKLAEELVDEDEGVEYIIGLAGGALVGVAGGMKVGDKLEDVLSHGVPRDELTFYEDELRQGRSVVVAVVATDEEAASARDAMASVGTGRIDPARQDASVGLPR